MLMYRWIYNIYAERDIGLESAVPESYKEDSS